jgi:threonine aldolase
LPEDHANARLLADAAAEVRPDVVDPGAVETNIVCLEGVDAPVLVADLAERGVRAAALTPRTVRLVTHAGVTTEECRRAAKSLREALAAVG